MRTGHLSGVVFLYICIAILASIAEERNVMNVANATAIEGSTHLSTLWILFHPNPLNIATWFGAIWNVATLWFNGTLWQGRWIWVYYLVVASLVLGVFEAYIMQILQAGLSVLGSVLGVIGRAIGLGR